MVYNPKKIRQTNLAKKVPTIQRVQKRKLPKPKRIRGDW